MSVDPVQRWNATLSAGAVAASFAAVSPRFAAAVAIGAALEALNFRVLHGCARRFFSGELAGAWSATYALRFMGLVLCIAAAVYLGAHPIGLLIGLSLIVPAVVIAAWRNRPPVVAGAPALAPDDPAWDRWDPWLARERDPDEDDWDQP